MRVLLSGYYGYGNAGDEALLGGLLAGLAERGFEPVVASGDPEATRRLHGVAAVNRVSGLPLAILRSDAVISGGGGLLQDVTSGRSLRYYLTVIEAARRLGRKVVVYGQSVGPLSEPGRKAVLRSLRGLAVAVRDRPSLELLRAGGLSAELVADPALLLPGDAPISCRSEWSRRVLLIPRAGHPELTSTLAAAARPLQERGFAPEVLLLHPAEDGAEGEALGASLPGMPVTEAADPRVALAQIADAYAVASARLHGLILAAAAGVPFAGLVYDPKVAGFLELAGAPAFGSPAEAPALVAALLESSPEDFRARGEELRARARAGIDWLERELRGDREGGTV